MYVFKTLVNIKCVFTYISYYLTAGRGVIIIIMFLILTTNNTLQIQISEETCNLSIGTLPTFMFSLKNISF